MKKEKPPRRRCPHLRLTVVGRAAAVSCWGQSWRDRSSGECPGRWVGSGSWEPGHRWARARWEQVARRVAGSSTEDRSLGAWKGHGAVGHARGEGPPDQAFSLWLRHSGKEAWQLPLTSQACPSLVPLRSLGGVKIEFWLGPTSWQASDLT